MTKRCCTPRNCSDLVHGIGTISVVDIGAPHFMNSNLLIQSREERILSQFYSLPILIAYFSLIYLLVSFSPLLSLSGGHFPRSLPVKFSMHVICPHHSYVSSPLHIPGIQYTNHIKCSDCGLLFSDTIHFGGPFWLFIQG
jgi:hypothetical protein